MNNLWITFKKLLIFLKLTNRLSTGWLKYFKKSEVPSFVHSEPLSTPTPPEEVTEVIESRFVEEFLEFQETNSIEPPVKKTKTKSESNTKISKKPASKKKSNAKKNS